MKTYVIFGRYYGTQAEAKAAAKANDVKFNPEDDTVEVPTDKDGLIDYLNKLASQIAGPLNENAVEEYTTVVERQDPPVAESAPLVFEEQFEAMPIAQQLHYASIALERARDQLGRETRPTPAAQGYGGKAPRPADDDELFS